MRSPLYAMLYNAGTLISHTSDYQLPAGCGCSQSLLVMPSASSELASHSAGVIATPKRILRYLGYPLQPFVTDPLLSHILSC